MHVDHVVPVAEAWRSGAAEWSEERREEFNIDPDNLVLTAANLNIAKSDDGPDAWMPPYEPYHCDYIGTYVAVKTKYELAVDESEKQALEKLAGAFS